MKSGWRGRVTGDHTGQMLLPWKKAKAPSPSEPPPDPTSNPTRRRIRFPVPRPLRDAVERGVFGFDKSGRPIRPDALEIRAITQTFADRLIDLLDDCRHAEMDDAVAKEKCDQEFNTALADYAEDFGRPAAGDLEAYVRRQASLPDLKRTERGRHY